MKQFEELFFIISEDFHADLNPILKVLDSEVDEHPHFIGKNSLYKLYLVKDLLLNLSKEGAKKSFLVSLRQVLKTYELKFKKYFENYGIATGYVYYSKNNLKNIKNYFFKIEDYCFQFKYKFKFNVAVIYFLSLDMRGFPSDCSVRLKGSEHKNDYHIELQKFPASKQEEIRGKTMYDLESELSDEVRFPLIRNEAFKKYENEIRKEFEVFCEKVKRKNEEFFELFQDIHQLISGLEVSNKNKPDWHTELYELLFEHRYINCSLDNFIEIFLPSFSSQNNQKIEWMKSKFWLRYLKENLEKLDPGVTFKWIEDRFYISTIRETGLSKELRKPQEKGKYYIDWFKSLSNDEPLVKFFMEH